MVYVNEPRWRRLDEKEQSFTSRHGEKLYLARLGFQFYISPENREKGVRFTFVRCEAFLWTNPNSPTLPSVYLNIIPKDLYDGEPRTVK